MNNKLFNKKLRKTKELSEGLRTRFKTLTGIVTRLSDEATAIVELDRLVFLKKYQRYFTKIIRYKCHVGKELRGSVKPKNPVLFKECRPLSKTKFAVITQILKNE